ncbi:Putative ribonuclease H protein [Arachis hypogaea]|nr:Putative ribonuclease H protein [Arachis hypogaea]
MTGLKINYNKSVLIGVNCSNEEVELACKMLGCKNGSLPMNYLGIPLGANPRRIETWKPVIRKVEDRLKGWKSRYLSKAEKLVLIKAVLNNLPMCYLNLFKMPKAVATKITSLQSRFFWEKSDGMKGMAIVSWSLIQKPKSHGGLGVGDLVLTNAALLFKWWWYFDKKECPL